MHLPISYSIGLRFPLSYYYSHTCTCITVVYLSVFYSISVYLPISYYSRSTLPYIPDYVCAFTYIIYLGVHCTEERHKEDVCYEVYEQGHVSREGGSEECDA